MVKDKKEQVRLIKKLQYIADINPTKSLNTLNVNNQKSPNKRQTVDKKKEKTRSNSMLASNNPL